MAPSPTSLVTAGSFGAGEGSKAAALRHREQGSQGRHRLYLAAIERLISGRPDEARLPRLYPAEAGSRIGGAMHIVLNAANGSAGETLVAGRIGFCAISEYVEAECSTFSQRSIAAPSPISEAPATDEEARQAISAWTEATQLRGAGKGR